MAGMCDINLFLRNLPLNIYKQLHNSILICSVKKQSLFSGNVPLFYDVNTFSPISRTKIKVAFLNIKLNYAKCKFYTLISVYDVRIWIRNNSSSYIILRSALLPFTNIKSCLLFLRHTCKERTKRVTKVATQNTNTSKKFLNPFKSQTVSL